MSLFEAMLLIWLFAVLRELVLGRRARTRRQRERRAEARRLAADGWDVMPEKLIGPDGPVLMDTAWNHLRGQLEAERQRGQTV